MNDGWFSASVPISVGIVGDVQHVLSARQAVNLLNGNWREHGSAQYRAALRACLGAINGDTSVEVARQAFIQAAREARVLFADDNSVA